MKRIALVGMPNTGKSTLFNRLSGGNARVANWPGLTVELAARKVLLGAHMVELVDLPGIHDLSGGAEDERITQQFLAQAPLQGVLMVLNALQLDRQLALALQLKALGFPLVVALNMSDEARRAGVHVDCVGLAAELGCPVLLIAAKHGDGIPALRTALGRLADGAVQLPTAGTPPPAEGQHAEEARLYAAYVTRAATLPPGLTQRLDRWALHPLAGLVLFVTMMFLLFQLTYALGAPLQDGLEQAASWLGEHAVDPLLAPLPAWLAGLLKGGLWDGVVTVLTFAPIIFLFFCLMAVIEDSGYFARAAFLADALMARAGLDGRGFVMLMMGFGCNVPALMGTRVIRDGKARRLAMLAIPFALCTARLQIFLFLAGALFTPAQAPWVLLSLYLISIALALGTALLLRRWFVSAEPFALELPPYRLPLPGQVWRRGWHETRAFLRLASTMIVLGVALVWALTHYPSQEASYAHTLARVFEPVLAPIGIDGLLAIPLLFGFVAKEVVLGALAVLAGQEGEALAAVLTQTLDPVSAYSFMLFTLTYVPCVSAVATLYKESGSLRYAAFAVVWSLGLAWLLCLAFYQGARLIF
ncbi:ferrous iron transport protein B [Chitiniphilus purpureus]|uniref:Ferrous iron transport protein B n=1 Tax=Chitiniphilus purpureus TaxID=2981137 RepID=A0ABY6DL68_9NEIS|nr:ferrous iron transport protein B [Chitiniphilus sp. CD1]UXY15104.1 ferrous iron transport protein B [Chitiniphilus sp. CD1]